MLLLPLVFGWWVFAAEPDLAGTTADLARVARLGAPREQGVVPAGEPTTESAEYLVESAARATLVYLLPDGPRTIRSVEIVPTPPTAEAWRLARLRLTWEDDDPDPARAGVDLPLGLAFGRAGGVAAAESLAVGTAADGAWVNRFPMPYRDRALLRIDTRAPQEGIIRVRTSRGVDPDAGYLRGTHWTSPGRFAVSGRGQLAGLFLVTEGQGPSSADVLSLDGKPAGPLLSVFGADNLRRGSGPVQGFLTPEGGSSRTAALSVVYRWRVADPIAFREGFSLASREDVRSAVNRSAAVFWYSEAPGPRRQGRSR